MKKDDYKPHIPKDQRVDTGKPVPRKPRPPDNFKAHIPKPRQTFSGIDSKPRPSPPTKPIAKPERRIESESGSSSESESEEEEEWPLPPPQPCGQCCCRCCCCDDDTPLQPLSRRPRRARSTSSARELTYVYAALGLESGRR